MTSSWMGFGLCFLCFCSRTHENRHSAHKAICRLLLCAVCPWVSLCKLTLDELYLVLLRTHTCAHTHCGSEMLWLGQLGYMISCNAAHRLARTCYRGDGRKPPDKWKEWLRLERLGSGWRAGIGSFQSPPAHCCYCDCQVESLISDLFMWSRVVVETYWSSPVFALSLLFIQVVETVSL